MKLYSYYRSVSSYRVRIALNVKEQPYDYLPIHLVRNGGEQYAPEYKALNPQAMVPTLVDGDFTLTQPMAILEYLEEKYPQPPLLPATAEARAYARQVAQVSVADIGPLLNLRILNHLSGDFGVSQAQKTEWIHKWTTQGLEAVEALLERSPFRTGPYVSGDAVTIADICLIPQVYAARRHEVPLDKFPLIANIDNHCMKLKVFIDASPENQPDTPEDQRLPFLKGKS